MSDMSNPSDDNVVRFNTDDLPEPTRHQVARVKAMPDDEIDTSDVPELSDADFRRARKPTVIRLAPDTREWLMSQPDPDQLIDRLIQQHRRQLT